MDFLFETVLTKPVWMWATFLSVVVLLLVLDLGVLHRKTHAIGVRESLAMSAGYMTIGLLFGAWVWFELGRQAGVEYVTGFLIEKSLALDNIFIIASIFAAFAIPPALQHRVLFWGILGVIVLRGILIGTGAALVANFEWVLLIFAVFLLLAGAKMLFSSKEHADPRDNAVYRWISGHLRMTHEFEGAKFVVRKPHPVTGKIVPYATPLLLALIMVELADVLFAVDSVPAIFAITTDPYIVFTSNIFAILGLRALYFALAAITARFAYLKQALALLLIFIGGKVIAAELMGLEKFPAPISLGVTAALLTGGVIYSMWRTKREAALTQVSA